MQRPLPAAATARPFLKEVMHNKMTVSGMSLLHQRSGMYSWSTL
jgi:hypothetical protein